MGDTILNLSALDKDQKSALVQIIKDEGLVDCNFIIQNQNDKGNNYMGEMICITIRGKNHNDKIVTLNLLLKTSPRFPEMRKKMPITTLYYKEIYSYKTMLPALKDVQDKFTFPNGDKFNFVKCYKTYGAICKEFLVMDDLSIDGFKMSARKKPLDIHHMRLVMKNIAYYHSLSFALKKQNPDLYREISKDVEDNQPYNEFLEIFLNVIAKNTLEYLKESELKNAVGKYFKEIYMRVMKCIAAETCEPYNVLCHGDYWQNNILFKYQDEVPVDLRIIDWQMVKHCSPIIDISHLLYSATEESLRKDHQEELLELYYDTLKTSLSILGCDIEECYPKSVFRDQLKKISNYGFTYTMISLSLLMREENDVPDLEEVMKEDDLNDMDLKFKNKKSVDDFAERISGVIRDFVRLDLL